jgi:hypothetical protein
MPPDETMVPDTRGLPKSTDRPPLTFRIWTREWGGVATLPFTIAVVVGWFTLGFDHWFPKVVSLVMFPYCIYSLTLMFKYPRYTDLPEFKEWAAQRERTVVI